MALRGTFKRVRICPRKGVNMPRTSPTTNGHNCNIVYLIHTCSHSPIHAGTHSATHYHTFSLNTCCFSWQPGGWWITVINAASGALVAWWTKFWKTDNVLLPCEGQHHTVAIYAKCNNKIQRIVNYCHCCTGRTCPRGGACPTGLVVITFWAIFFKIYKTTNYKF